MKPYGANRNQGYDTEPRMKAGRSLEKRIGEQLAEEQLDSQMDSAELRLIDCDAGHCALCGGPCGYGRP